MFQQPARTCQCSAKLFTDPLGHQQNPPTKHLVIRETKRLSTPSLYGGVNKLFIKESKNSKGVGKDSTLGISRFLDLACCFCTFFHSRSMNFSNCPFNHVWNFYIYGFFCKLLTFLASFQFSGKNPQTSVNFLYTFGPPVTRPRKDFMFGQRQKSL